MGSRGVGGTWGAQPRGTFSRGEGPRGGDPRAGELNGGKESIWGWGGEQASDVQGGGRFLQVVGHSLFWGPGEAGLRQLAVHQPPEGAVQEEALPAAQHPRGRAPGHPGVQEPVPARALGLPRRRRALGRQPPLRLRAEQR